MQYDTYHETILGLRPSKHLKREFREELPTNQYFTCKNFLHEKMDEKTGHEFTSEDFVSFGIVVHAQSNIESPWKEYYCARISDNIRINIKTVLLSNFAQYLKGFLIEDTQLLLQTDKALESISKKVEALSEGLFSKIRSIPPSRTPGFVIDGWIVVPKYDRDLEYKIYKELGNVIRNNPNLLFNIHVIAKKGRELSEILPKGYRRYSSWLGYIC